MHAAYWKYTVTRRFTGAARGSFPLKGSNFFPRTGPADPRAWRQDVALLSGIAAHDLYHAGQIQLLKRLHADRR